MRIQIFFLLLALSFQSTQPDLNIPNPMNIPSDPSKRISRQPYISGDGFREICNHWFDEAAANFDPELVQAKDLIFIRVDLIGTFLETYHSKIPNPYIIISHNGDDAVPNKYAHYLDDPKIIAWFSQNIDTKHPKLYGLPIGLPNKHWPRGKTNAIIDAARKTMPSLQARQNKAYMNFLTRTNPKVRNPVYSYFANKPFCKKSQNLSHHDFLTEIVQCKFVISPPGNGVDCVRHWESLLLGSIPIIQHSSIDELFTDLPVIFINNWHEVNEHFLMQQLGVLKNKTFNYEKLFLNYWINKIKNIQNQA